jgi:hypothetical protein
VGVFLLLRSSENDEDSLDFGPKINDHNFIRYDRDDKNSVFKVVRAIDDYLKSKKKFKSFTDTSEIHEKNSQLTTQQV